MKSVDADLVGHPSDSANLCVDGKVGRRAVSGVDFEVLCARVGLAGQFGQQVLIGRFGGQKTTTRPAIGNGRWSMSEPIVYIDRSGVREGKLDELKAAIKELVDFVESNEPRAMAYSVYLNENGSQMTVVQAHPDSASLEFHMNVAGPAFAKFKDLIQLLTIDVYGNPSDQLRKQLLDKARMLGGGTMAVHNLQTGFTRFGVS